LDWYEEAIEKPIRDLIKTLRNNGFNTFCSCGHYPNPYIQIEWYSDDDITRLWNLLSSEGYYNWVITATWPYDSWLAHRIIEIKFYPPSGKKEGLCDPRDLTVNGRVV